MGRGRIALFAALCSCGVFTSSRVETPPEDPSAPPVAGVPVTGIFVSDTLGDDTLGDGSRERPFKTIKAGMARAKDLNQRVIVCAERYVERVDLLDGVSLYGAFDCNADWALSEGRAEIASPEERGLVANGIMRKTRVEGFTIRSADLAPGIRDQRKRTSIAVHVKDSAGLTFASAVLIGGAGSDGADGSTGANNVELNSQTFGRNGTGQTTICPFSGAEVLLCGSAIGLGGASGGSSRCQAGVDGNPGGRGGDGAHYPNPAWQNPNAEYRGRAVINTPATAQGGGGAAAGAGVAAGGFGGNGAIGPNGASGSNGLGFFDVEGFVSGDGAPGGPGGPGQGGGGGGGNEFWRNSDGGPQSLLVGAYPASTGWWTATGAGGGAGGCGGLPGSAGTGGGASVGLFVTNSALSLDRVVVRASKGGRAGQGTLGHNGLPGGGPGAASDWGGAGGFGGTGGTSGISGSGAAGQSVALVYLGSRPTMERVELIPGEGGAGVPELTKIGAGANLSLPAVSAGAALAEHVIQ